MRITSVAAAMLLVTTSALAQGTTSPGGQTTSPTTPPATGAAPSGTAGDKSMDQKGTTGQTGAATTTMQKQAGSGQLQFYSHQTGEMRASQLIGETVRNQQNENVGEINELILNKNGEVVAAVIGVGGFLGIGEREVAVDFNSLSFERDANATGGGRDEMTPKLAATKDTLKNAPAWEWSDRNAGAGTGTTGTGTTNRPTNR